MRFLWASTQLCQQKQARIWYYIISLVPKWNVVYESIRTIWITASSSLKTKQSMLQSDLRWKTTQVCKGPETEDRFWWKGCPQYAKCSPNWGGSSKLWHLLKTGGGSAKLGVVPQNWGIFSKLGVVPQNWGWFLKTGGGSPKLGHLLKTGGGHWKLGCLLKTGGGHWKLMLSLKTRVVTQTWGICSKLVLSVKTGDGHWKLVLSLKTGDGHWKLVLSLTKLGMVTENWCCH